MLVTKEILEDLGAQASNMQRAEAKTFSIGLCGCWMDTFLFPTVMQICTTRALVNQLGIAYFSMAL